MADLRAAWAEVGHLRTLVERAHFEGAAGAGGGFSKIRAMFSRPGFAFTSGFFGGLSLDGGRLNLPIVFYVQIMPDDFVMQLHRF
jgi:hypothetical protein